MTTLQVRELSGKRLRQVTTSLGPGLHVLWTLDSTGTDELIPLLDGSTAPRRGSVRLDERMPYRDPALRRHIGSVWSEESLPEARHVRESLARLDLDRNVRDQVRTLLEQFGLATLLDRSPQSLDRQQTRQVALAVALSKADLQLLLLHEPLATVAGNSASVVTQLVLKHAAQIPVLVVTGSRNTATRLGGPSAELGGGFWRRSPAQLPDHFTLRVAGTNLRSLAAEIVRRPLVRSLRVTTHAEGHDELWLETADPGTLSLDLVRVAQQLGTRVWSMVTLAGSG